MTIVDMERKKTAPERAMPFLVILFIYVASWDFVMIRLKWWIDRKPNCEPYFSWLYTYPDCNYPNARLIEIRTMTLSWTQWTPLWISNRLKCLFNDFPKFKSLAVTCQYCVDISSTCGKMIHFTIASCSIE